MQYINAQLEVLYNKPTQTLAFATSTDYNIDDKSIENDIQSFVMKHKDDIDLKYAIREMTIMNENILETILAQYFDNISVYPLTVHPIDSMTPMHVYAVSLVDDTSINSTTKVVSKIV